MLYADRVIEYSEFKQINILKKEGKMDGQLKVAAVQVTVEQNNIKKNMENVEKMAMTVAENEKNVDLILFMKPVWKAASNFQNSIRNYLMKFMTFGRA